MSVSREELPDAERAGAVGRAKQYRVAVPPSDELDAAQNECSHHDLTDLALQLQHAEHLVAIENDDFPVFIRTNAHERGTSGEQVGLTGELPCLMQMDESLSLVRDAKNLDRAAHDDEARRMRIARLHQCLAAPHRAA